MVEIFTPTDWWELAWPVAVHEAQQKSCRSRVFDAPSTDVAWCARVPFAIGLILLSEEAF
jgi:hypothetical protein